ncbi:branched-chain amino acid ABC transporter permease [Chloroflexota bacterium]
MDAATILLQLCLSGALVGGIYGLIAMGFVITYRSAGVFNIAYGQFAVIGAFIAWTFIGLPSAPRLPLPLAYTLTIITAILFGLIVERVLFRRMIGKPIFATFMLTLGLLAVLHSLVLLIWGPSTKAIATAIPKGPVNLGGIVLAQEYIWSFTLSILVALALILFLRNTRLGLAMRAAYEDQTAARCLGVSAELNAMIAWVMCAVIATIGGILIASVSGISMMLSEMVLLVLAVVLIGGLDSLAGCIVGGLILAIGHNLTSYYLGPLLPGIDGIFNMVLILVILLVRPTGLLGVRPIERV